MATRASDELADHNMSALCQLVPYSIVEPDQFRRRWADLLPLAVYETQWKPMGHHSGPSKEIILLAQSWSRRCYENGQVLSKGPRIGGVVVFTEGHLQDLSMLCACVTLLQVTASTIEKPVVQLLSSHPHRPPTHRLVGTWGIARSVRAENPSVQVSCIAPAPHSSMLRARSHLFSIDNMEYELLLQAQPAAP
eukprot:5555275-Prymnesium_polylepis.1